MDSPLKLFLLVCGLAFVGAVINLLIKRKISERNSIFWLLGAIAILILAAVPEILEFVATSIGIDYPPSLLFLLSTLILLLIVLHQSIQISILSEQVKELTQHVAINKFKQKYTKAEDESRKPADFRIEEQQVRENAKFRHTK